MNTPRTEDLDVPASGPTPDPADVPADVPATDSEVPIPADPIGQAIAMIDAVLKEYEVTSIVDLGPAYLPLKFGQIMWFIANTEGIPEHLAEHADAMVMSMISHVTVHKSWWRQAEFVKKFRETREEFARHHAPSIAEVKKTAQKVWDRADRDRDFLRLKLEACETRQHIINSLTDAVNHLIDLRGDVVGGNI